MPGITGAANTYNCPNFVGELFSVSPEDTPFLSAIGGLTGGKSVSSTVWTWQSYDLRDPEDDRQRLEGADAPDPDGRARVQASNVVEIHQESVGVTYTKQGATQQVATGGAAAMRLGVQPVADELAFQLNAQFKQIARDVEKTFITGTYNLPTDATTARRTRGLLEAITTNVVTNSTPADLSEDMVLDLMQTVWENGGIQESETRTIIVGARQKRALTKIFISGKNYREESRNVGGVNLQTIETDFGRCNIMLNRYMPADTLVVASLEECQPAFLEIPGLGHFFAEPLAKTGSTTRYQVYGEIGLEYGNERKHGKITGLSTGDGNGGG